MTTISTADRAQALRSWARGDVALEAAVEVLIQTHRGRLLGGPWVRKVGARRWWFDPACAHAESGHLSGGERRALAIAMSLASRDYAVGLGDVLTGLDTTTAATVVRALAHAARITPLTT